MPSVKYFYSNNCPVCEKMKSEIENFTLDHNIKLQTINVDTPKGARKADKQNIYDIPHTVIKDRNCEKNIIGFASEKELNYALEKSCSELDKKPIHKA